MGSLESTSGYGNKGSKIIMYEAFANNDDKFGGIGTSRGAVEADGRSTNRSPLAVARYELRPEHWTSPVVGN
jgi:hypothetical protein